MYSDKVTACLDDSRSCFPVGNRFKLARLSQTLSFKQASLALLVAFALGILFSLFQIRTDLVTEKQRLDQSFTQILKVANPSAVQAAFGLDNKLAENVVAGLFEYDAVCGAQIVDNQNVVMAEKKRKEVQSPLKPIVHYLFGPPKEFKLKLYAANHNMTVGSLSITVDTLVIAERFFERSALTLVSGLLRSLLLAAILGVLFYFVLTRPIKQVAEHIKIHQTAVEVPKSHQRDELGELIEAYNNQFEERAKAQKHLFRLNLELEKRVAERTKQLESSKQDLEQRVESRTRELILATETAQAASRAKSDFLAHMSHELRTPLNAIIGFSQIWVEEMFGEIKNQKYKEYAIDINQASTHLLTLISDILDVSKLEAGEMELNATEIDVRELVEKGTVLVADSVSHKTIDLSVTIEPPVAHFVADPRLLRQILHNILHNAVKFSHPGGKVEINATQGSDGALILAVVDYGCGIEALDIKRVLEPFNQTRDRPDLTHDGAGLGLPISKRFVELHGGTLALESIVDQKTVVTVSLPRRPAP